MQPTMKLRFVERDIGGRFEPMKLVNILQQWWERLSSSGVVIEGEWRDVPVEQLK